jgi:ubiquitin thioesterase protein OTUB1
LEYTSQTFIAKIDWLVSKGWTGLRRSRGDGDCFYRSMAFAYVERILQARDQAYAIATSLSIIENGLSNLKAVGFDPMAVRN